MLDTRWYSLQNGIVCKMTICKMIQFARLQATNENTRDGKRANLKDLLRPHKLPQGAPAKSVKARVKIGKKCPPLVGPSCIRKVFKEGQPP